ncbi:STAS domain-containing protein [Fictibacillus barbaricus]|uniref:RsbT co-antagonist protein RsbR n=1 Tax=Fictibacillus barbaricus TaxID=182136 RepID=A0ABU1U4V5_9BACL|nr:STAS domain-containing protein [Fictibacillus barbaricus]MDR7074406.1 rsbT co-antagonist protein RsbR [Fictibacillus barbaricus]
MHRDKELHAFLIDKTWQMTEEWYASIDKSKATGVYASTDPKTIATLKKQNHDFHLHFCEVFVTEESKFLKDFEKWVTMIAQDDEHLNTPVTVIMAEFFKVQRQYLGFVREFVYLHEGEYSQTTIDAWNEIIINTFNKIVTWFVEENQKVATQRLEAQQEMINELSMPVIALNKQMGLLPLIGEIDTTRARFIVENTLQHCIDKDISHLLIDLSGVLIIDTMVAQQIFQLVETLSLIGVKSTLSGIRPEIAMTAVQLGLSFESITIKSNLAQAISEGSQ